MLAQSALANQMVKGLQHGIGEPLGRVGANEDSVFNDPPNEIQRAVVFDKPTHPIHHHRRAKTIIKVPDITSQAPFCAFPVVVHPRLYPTHSTVNTSSRNAATAVKVHHAHKHRLKHLYQGVVDILVWVQLWFIDFSPLSGICIPTGTFLAWTRSETR